MTNEQYYGILKMIYLMIKDKTKEQAMKELKALIQDKEFDKLLNEDGTES